MFATRSWEPSGSGGVDDAFVQQFGSGIGAEIMGAGKFGHPGWHEDPEWKARGVPTRRSTRRSSSSPITRALPSKWRAARRFTYRRVACRGTRGCRRPGRTHRWGSHRDSRLPCRRAHRPLAHRGGPDLARPRRAPMGRTGRQRDGLSGRGHILAQRSHASDVYSRVSAFSTTRAPRPERLTEVGNIALLLLVFGGSLYAWGLRRWRERDGLVSRRVGWTLLAAAIVLPSTLTLLLPVVSILVLTLRPAGEPRSVASRVLPRPITSLRSGVKAHVHVISVIRIRDHDVARPA